MRRGAAEQCAPATASAATVNIARPARRPRRGTNPPRSGACSRARSRATAATRRTARRAARRRASSRSQPLMATAAFFSSSANSMSRCSRRCVRCGSFGWPVAQLLGDLLEGGDVAHRVVMAGLVRRASCASSFLRISATTRGSSAVSSTVCTTATPAAPQQADVADAPIGRRHGGRGDDRVGAASNSGARRRRRSSSACAGAGGEHGRTSDARARTHADLPARRAERHQAGRRDEQVADQRR